VFLLRYKVFGITDAKKATEDYGEDVGKFVIIRFIEPESKALVKAYGILTKITQSGLLRVIGNDGETRHIDPNSIKNYHAKTDKFLNGSFGGGKNR